MGDRVRSVVRMECEPCTGRTDIGRTLDKAWVYMQDHGYIEARGHCIDAPDIACGSTRVIERVAVPRPADFPPWWWAVGCGSVSREAGRG